MNPGKILIQGATVIDPQSPFHLQKADILLENGTIVELGMVEANDAEIVDGNGKYVSVGWMDMRVNFCEPGDEHKETIETGCHAAQAGGFTAVAALPSLDPVTDHKSQVKFISAKSATSSVKVYALGTLSVGAEGKELAELYDMHQAGAIGFTDGERPIQKSGLLLRALQYCQPFGARVLVHSEDTSLSAGGRMHEGVMSVSLGLKGIPPLAESVAIARDLQILKYTGGRLHFSKISTSESVDLIRKAKQEGLDVTADVTIHHLVLSDESLHEFDTHYKMVPPLRSQDHIDALIAGVNDGTIDCIVSDHCPENIEHKAVEFEYAAPGVIGTQIVYSLYQTYLNDKISLEKFITCITKNPRKCLGLTVSNIDIGCKAEITLFSADEKYIFDNKHNKSLSKNTPFLGKEFRGRALRIFV